ncbi:MAG: cytochrome P450 [Candidatus Methylomirabilales bacterium]
MGLDPTTIPGPPPMTVLRSGGNLIQFLRDPIAYIRTLYQTYGEIVALVKGRKGIIFAFGPHYNQQILSDPAVFHCTGITLPGPPESAQRRLGHAIFRMNADQHAQHRRIIMPPFHKKSIESYRDSLVSLTQQMLDTWQSGQQRDIAHEMKKFTIRTTAEILFGLNDYPKPYMIADMVDRWMSLSTSFTVRLLPVNFPGTPYHRVLTLAERLEKEILALINHRRTDRSGGNDILSLLLLAHNEQGNGLTDADLIGQTNLLFIAGYETIFNALTWTLFLLAQHPPIMAHVLDELEGTLRGDPPALEQLSQLPLLECVIKESMRVLPPVVYNTRNSIEPFRLGSYELPKGSTVGFSHYITHHMPELYPQPEKFLPQRWLTIDPSPYEYLPFGAAPRMCIGAAFAMMTLKVSLSMILQRYRLTVVPGATIDRNGLVTLSPKHGMPMLIRLQDRQFIKSEVRGNIHEMVDLRTH